MSQTIETTPAPAARGLFWARLAVAAVQGLALYGLTFAAEAPRGWPATQPQLFAPLLLLAAYLPVVINVGLGQLTRRRLAIWGAAAAIVIALIGWTDAAQGRVDYAGASIPWPWWPLWPPLTAALFVAQALAVDSFAEKRWLTAYSRHFETAWKQGLQLVLAALFVGVFWGVLQLGAGLFDLLTIHAVRDLISHGWFAWPASALALAIAIHVTDVQPALTRGARDLVLTLLSWLLPLLCVLVVAFLVSIPFTSLKPLWRTHFATGLLLASAAWLVLLINAAYQDGGSSETVHPAKKIAGVAAALALAPMLILAAVGLGLRVEQYGWSVSRIFAAAAVLIGALHAFGYAGAVVAAPRWLKRIEIVNVVGAYAALVVFLLLFSPIATPARLMVDDQMGRLASGHIGPAQLDLASLDRDGARWGRATVRRLADRGVGPNAAKVRAAALALLDQRRQEAIPPEVSAARGPVVEMLQPGRTVPPEVLARVGGLAAGGLPGVSCQAGEGCLARFVQLERHRPPSLVILNGARGLIFEQGADGKWVPAGRLNSSGCDSDPAFRAGQIRQAPHPDDIVVGDVRFQRSPLADGCVGAPAPMLTPTTVHLAPTIGRR